MPVSNFRRFHRLKVSTSSCYTNRPIGLALGASKLKRLQRDVLQRKRRRPARRPGYSSRTRRASMSIPASTSIRARHHRREFPGRPPPGPSPCLSAGSSSSYRVTSPPSAHLFSLGRARRIRSGDPSWDSGAPAHRRNHQQPIAPPAIPLARPTLARTSSFASAVPRPSPGCELSEGDAEEAGSGVEAPVWRRRCQGCGGPFAGSGCGPEEEVPGEDAQDWVPSATDVRLAASPQGGCRGRGYRRDSAARGSKNGARGRPRATGSIW